jgi:hypothetical protein
MAHHFRDIEEDMRNELRIRELMASGLGWLGGFACSGRPGAEGCRGNVENGERLSMLVFREDPIVSHFCFRFLT